MPTLAERIAARIAFHHANRVYSTFRRDLADAERVQQQTLRRVLASVADSDYGREHRLSSVMCVSDFRKAAPLTTYDKLLPYVQRVMAGDQRALFRPPRKIQMFATSSGTTAERKYVPVTPEFVRQYRRGWNTFGLKLLSDHPQAVLRPILQSSGRWDESTTASGVPCGAITGLLARTQKRIVRRFYIGLPEMAYIDDPHAKYYTLMRFGIVRDVAFAITANPATLIQLAQTASDESERLIRDVRDGTLASELVTDAPLRRRLETRLKSDPSRARELESIRRQPSTFRPRNFWNIEFLACWTGGSMGHYLDRLADWWGPVPVRDVGLLASEGRVSIPLADGVPAGVLDVRGSLFEFIPAADLESETPDTLTAAELEIGGEYAVVLTNDAGLIRYRLDDVVRVVGVDSGVPIVEFLYRGGRVASVAGEKLTENQLVEAVRTVCRQHRVAAFDYVAAPRWGEPPHYLLSCSADLPSGFAHALDAALSAVNDEYESRRKTNRLGCVQTRAIPPDAISLMDTRLAASRKSHAEQYKRPTLFRQPGDDDAALNIDARR